MVPRGCDGRLSKTGRGSSFHNINLRKAACIILFCSCSDKTNSLDKNESVQIETRKRAYMTVKTFLCQTFLCQKCQSFFIHGVETVSIVHGVFVSSCNLTDLFGPRKRNRAVKMSERRNFSQAVSVQISTDFRFYPVQQSFSVDKQNLRTGAFDRQHASNTISLDKSISCD